MFFIQHTEKPEALLALHFVEVLHESRGAHFSEFPARFQVGRTSQNGQVFWCQVGAIFSLLYGDTSMAYERQKTIRKELEGIPRGLRGSPQNQVRQIVASQYQHGKSFDESVEIAVTFVRQSYPTFMPKILPLSAQT